MIAAITQSGIFWSLIIIGVMWIFVIIWARQDYKSQVKKWEKKNPYKASKEVDRLL